MTMDDDMAREFSGVFAQSMRDWVQRVKDMPPPTSIHCHAKVPVGKAYRQYMTDGRLRVWVNDFTFALLPKANHEKVKSLLDANPFGGIPVYIEEPTLLKWRAGGAR